MTPSADLPGFGKPFMPTVSEQQGTAATQNTLLTLDITTDTLSKPMTQKGWDTKWKYQSSASNPSIAMLAHFRLPGDAADVDDPNLLDSFSQLVNQLPDDVRSDYLKQSALPASQRNPSYNEVDKVLWLAAKAMALLGSPPALNEKNTANIGQTPQNAAALGSQVLSSVTAFLEDIGHSNLNFDDLMNVTNSMGTLLGDFTTLAAAGDKAPKEDWANLAKDFTSLNTQLQGKSIGNDLQMLLSTVAAMTLFANASALTSGSGALLIGLSIAQIGIGNSGSGGMVSPLVKNVIDNLAAVLSATSMPNGNSGSKQLLSLLLTGAFMGSASLAATTNNEVDGFGLGLILKLAGGSGLLDAFNSAIARAGGADGKTAPAASNMIGASALLFLIHSIAKEHSDVAASLLEELHAALADQLDSAELFMATHLADETISGKVAHRVNVGLEKCRAALEADDYDALLQATADLEHTIAAESGGSQHDKAWDKQQKTLKDLTAMLHGAGMTLHQETTSSTNIVQG